MKVRNPESEGVVKLPPVPQLGLLWLQYSSKTGIRTFRPGSTVTFSIGLVYARASRQASTLRTHTHTHTQSDSWFLWFLTCFYTEFTKTRETAASKVKHKTGCPLSTPTGWPTPTSACRHYNEDDAHALIFSRNNVFTFARSPCLFTA